MTDLHLVRDEDDAEPLRKELRGDLLALLERRGIRTGVLIVIETEPGRHRVLNVTTINRKKEPGMAGTQLLDLIEHLRALADEVESGLERELYGSAEPAGRTMRDLEAYPETLADRVRGGELTEEQAYRIVAREAVAGESGARARHGDRADDAEAIMVKGVREVVPVVADAAAYAISTARHDLLMELVAIVKRWNGGKPG